MRQMVNLLQASESILESIKLRKGFVNACIALGGVINEVLKSPRSSSQEISHAVGKALETFGFRVERKGFDVVIEGPFGELVVDILSLGDDPYRSMGEFFSKSFFTEAVPVLIGIFRGGEFSEFESFLKGYMGGMDVSFNVGDLVVGVFVFEDHLKRTRFQDALGKVLRRMGCRVDDEGCFREMTPFESFIPQELFPALRIRVKGDREERFCAGISEFLKNRGIKGIEFVVD